MLVCYDDNSSSKHICLTVFCSNPPAVPVSGVYAGQSCHQLKETLVSERSRATCDTRARD